jgi:hypothetical protein
VECPTTGDEVAEEESQRRDQEAELSKYHVVLGSSCWISGIFDAAIEQTFICCVVKANGHCREEAAMQLPRDLAGKEKTQEKICGFKNEEMKNETLFSSVDDELLQNNKVNSTG